MSMCLFYPLLTASRNLQDLLCWQLSTMWQLSNYIFFIYDCGATGGRQIAELQNCALKILSPFPSLLNLKNPDGESDSPHLVHTDTHPQTQKQREGGARAHTERAYRTMARI